ncbi:MAG TPA: error-prone DNA polymerase [Opitutaceae bacterium]|jgi:error-prone DNA polymerase
MTASDYVELHASSAFSFLRGASLPEELAEEAARLELPALAMLDRDGVFSAPRLYQAAREKGVRPLVGTELTLEDGTVLPLLAASRTGYRNLCRLLTTAKTTERSVEAASRRFSPTPKRRPVRHSLGEGGDAASTSSDPADRKRPAFATWQELSAHTDGLIALTGDEEGPLWNAWRNGGRDSALAKLEQLQKLFPPGRLWVEAQNRRIRGDAANLRLLASLADAARLPLLATGGVLHATREGRLIADVFCCLRHHTTLDRAGRRLTPNAERHLRSGARMAALFRDHPEAIRNSRRVAEQIDFTLAQLDYQFPEYPVPGGGGMETYLRERTYEGVRERFQPATPEVWRQIDRELALIFKLGFSGYFLIVWDICRWCHERGILIQGRGSAANSAVCYALRITAVDPIKSRLLFERFLSEGRVGKDGHPSWPDIDLDLPSGDLRESVIQEVYRRYGTRGAGMVANVITYRGRSSSREVGRVLGLPDDVLDRFSALYANGDFPQTLGLGKQLHLSGLPDEHPRLPAMITLCQRLQSLPRHLGQHSGGMVLCPGRLDQVVPIENASMPGRTVIQWDKDDCEDLGLVKIDFLGLGMMAVLQDCITLCERRGEPFHLHRIPYDDEATFAMMRRADTIGVFQVESRAQMSILPRMNPSCFYDVAIQVAIVRPGPITGGLTHPLVRRRAGLEPVVCIDPSIHEQTLPILGRTFGVVLFQEQMLALAMKLADFSGAEAEELRRALGFHRSHERLQRITAKLCAALQAKGHSPHVIEQIVGSASTFALYGFPESHAISFALLAYASTWLKVHRPAEFYASLLNNQPMGFYSSATLIQDGRRHGLKVKPVCIAHSEWKSTVEIEEAPSIACAVAGGADPGNCGAESGTAGVTAPGYSKVEAASRRFDLRLGLRCVKGLRESAVSQMAAEREKSPFTTLADFFRRTTFTAAERRALAAVGALNRLAGHRRAALWQVEAAWSADESLLQMTDLESTSPLPPMTLAERLGADFSGLGLTAGEHPMRLVRDRLPDVTRAADLVVLRNGERATIGGSVICRQRPGTAKGIVFVSLEDETGIANAIVSPEIYESHRLVINEESALRITGAVQNTAGVVHIKAQEIRPLRLDDLPAQASHDFH